jgi:hypothetical protein
MSNLYKVQYNLKGTDKSPEIVATSQYRDLSSEELTHELAQLMDKPDWQGTIIVQRFDVQQPAAQAEKVTKKAAKKVTKKAGRPKKDAAKKG